MKHLIRRLADSLFVAVFVLLTFQFAVKAAAEMRKLTVSAIVKEVDEEMVTVQIKSRTVRVSRKQISSADLVVGKKIMVVFRGDQIEGLLKGIAMNQTPRRPASKTPGN